jgi:hypothetical protein
MTDQEPENPDRQQCTLPPVSDEVRRQAFPFWNYQDLLIFLAMAVPCLLAGSLIVQLASAVIPAYPQTKAAKALPAQFVAYGLWFGCLYLLLKAKYDVPFWRAMSWRIPWRGFFYTLLGGPLLAICVASLGLVLKTPEIDMPIKEYLSDPSSVLMLGIFATTLGPMCEELAFRGFLMPLLQRSFGVAGAIVGSALPFALLHGPQYAWSWRHVLLITVTGTVFGWVRYQTRSTAASTVVHGLYNLTFFSAFLMQGRF